MQELGWSYEELMDCPYERYLDYRRLMSLEAKEKKKEQERQKRKQKRATSR